MSPGTYPLAAFLDDGAAVRGDRGAAVKILPILLMLAGCAEQFDGPVMRKVRPVTRALDDEGGWLFTETDGSTGPEQLFGFCWGRCHAAAPFNGAWYDYRR